MNKLSAWWQKYGFFSLTILLFWMKSYYALNVAFNLSINNRTQAFILFIAPLSSALFFFGIALFFSGKIRLIAIFIIDSILTIILYANVIYHRFFEDFLTVPVLFQFKNFAELGGSAKHLMKVSDSFYFLDIILLLIIVYFIKKPQIKIHWHRIIVVYTLAFFVLGFNLKLAYEQRSQLLGRTFDRAMLVKYLGIYNYHLYDIFLNGRTSSQRAFADSDELTHVENYLQSQYVKPNQHMFGIAKGKNIILVSLESTQNFLINYKLNGQEVTPFLNKLAKTSFYFDHFYHNTGQGKTSDAEFMIDTSLYGLPSGAVFTTNASNTFNATPKILKPLGYTAVSFHGNHKSFWNRDMMYYSLGYDRFFSKRNYEVSTANSVNYGIKDIPFLQQSMPMLEKVKQPFYAKFILLTNHYPFVLNSEQDKWIQPASTHDGTVNRYFVTARYEDEALKQFFNMLKATGLYDRSVIILYGDHYGISENHNRAMAQIIGKPITPFEHIQLQKVPLFIHIPGVKGKVMHTIGGEIDLKPTILHLLGVHTKGDIEFGTDLFSKQRKNVTIQRDGSVITDHFIYSAAKHACYEKVKDSSGITGVKVDRKLCQSDALNAKLELNLSDKVVYGDLLRFLSSKK